MTVVRNRTAVKATLTFAEQQKPQTDARAQGQKFSRALENAQEREEKRRQRGKKPEADEEEQAPEAKAEAPKPAGKRVQGAVVQNRQAELLKRLPPQQKKAKAVVVPRSIAEAATDPRMARPTAAELGIAARPDEETAWSGQGKAAPPLPANPFANDMETLAPDALEPLVVNQGDGSSLQLLDSAEFEDLEDGIDIDIDDSLLGEDEVPATFADLPETTQELADDEPVGDDVFSDTPYARRKR